jgi:hypothetical protein
MPIYRTGKSQSSIVRDPTIIRKGTIDREASYDYDIIDRLDINNELLKLMLLNLMSITDEEFRSDDTKGLI